METITVLTGAGISAESGLDTYRDVDGFWSRYNMEEVAVATVEGFVAHNKLKSLKGSPEIINGSFICSANKLNSLEGCPHEIKGAISFCSNPIKDISHIVKVGVLSCDFLIYWDFPTSMNDIISKIESLKSQGTAILDESGKYASLRDEWLTRQAMLEELYS